MGSLHVPVHRELSPSHEKRTVVFSRVLFDGSFDDLTARVYAHTGDKPLLTNDEARRR